MKVGNVNHSILNKAYSGNEKSAESGFAGVLKGAINEVDNMQKISSSLAGAAIAGRKVEVHDVMIAGQKSKLAFDLMLEVRNRLVDAYEELMRMRM
jgi:flagellar hook-basal body complex protein FliE